jgi:hypothetical protein
MAARSRTPTLLKRESPSYRSHTSHPAGVIDRVDVKDEKVYVNRTKDAIKNAPEFDQADYRDVGYRDRLGSYYGPGGAGYRDWD